MQNYSKVVLGVILILLGLSFLGNNYNWFDVDISFQKIAKWWPVLLILAGMGVFLNPDKRVSNPLTVLCISFAIPLAIFSSVSQSVEKGKKNFKLNLFPNGNEESFYSENDREELAEKGVRIQNFNVENQLGVEQAKLDFGGGAAEFFLETTKDNIFEAKTVLGKGSYKLESDKSGNEVDSLRFEKIY